MRNLKKVLALSLVFALVASFGFSAIAAEGGFSDYASIGADYREAAVELSFADGLGVFEGTNGAFNPTSTLSRAEFAAFVARVMMGGATDENGDKITNLFDGFKAATRFTDVPSTHWGAGEINYLAGMGIISGRSAGRFAPDEPVRPIEVYKMMLGLLNIDVSGMVGDGWDVKIMQSLRVNGLMDITNKIANDPILRQEAALALWTTLDKETFTVGATGLYVKTGEKALVSYFKGTNPDLNSKTIEGVLVKNKFANIDASGIGAQDGEVVLSVLKDGAHEKYEFVNGVFDDTAPTAMIGALVKLEVTQNNRAIAGKTAQLVDSKVNITVNAGNPNNYDGNVGPGSGTSLRANFADPTVLDGVQGNWLSTFTGVTEAYAFRFSGRNEYRNAFSMTYTFAKVTAKSDEKITIHDINGKLDGDSKFVDDRAISEVEGGSALAVGDYILIAKIDGVNRWVVKPVTHMVGQLTAFAGGKATVNGTAYDLTGLTISKATLRGATLTSAINAAGNYNTDHNYFFYDGKIIDFIKTAGPPPAPNAYCIILAVNDAESAGTFTAAKRARIQVLRDDGSTKIYDVAQVNNSSGGKLFDGDKTEVNDILNDNTVDGGLGEQNGNIKVFRYTLNDDETRITLFEEGTTGGGFNTTYTAGQTAFSGNIITANTIWFVRTQAGSGSWRAFKGTALPGTTAAYAASLYMKNGSIFAGIVNTGIVLDAPSNNFLYVSSDVSFAIVDGQVTAQFTAVDLKEGDNLGLISLIPGKALNGNDGISTAVGFAKGWVIEYTKTAEGYYKGDATEPTANASPTSLAGASGWFKLDVVSAYSYGNFQQAGNTFTGKSGTKYIDARDAADPKLGASNMISTYDGANPYDKKIEDVIVKVTFDSGLYVTDYVIITKGTANW